MTPTAPSPFVYLWGVYYTQLAATTTQLVSTVLAAVAGVVLGLYVLYIALLGVLLIWGKITSADIQARALRGVMVLAILSPTVFNEFVVQPFTTTIPAFSLQATGGSDLGAAGIPAQFDQIDHGIEFMLAQARAQASGVLNTGTRIEIGVVGGLIGFVLMVCFFVAIAAYALISILVVVFCVTCLGYLFERTQGIADRTVGKLVGLSLLNLMVLILLQFIVKQDTAYLATLASTPANIDAMLNALWSVLWVFGVGLFILVMLPPMAAYVGGGVSFSPTPLIFFVTRRFGRA